MDKLPDSLLLEILSRLDDSADVARCRVASKDFNTLFPGLRTINLQRTRRWDINSSSEVSSSERIKPFNTVFVDLISKLETVESVCIGLHPGYRKYWYSHSHTDDEFFKKWLPRVSESLKSLSISAGYDGRGTPSNVLSLISEYCHNLVNLKLDSLWLSMHNIKPMLMLTSLTLHGTRLEDKHLNELNKCFSNLQVLNLSEVNGLQDPKIHLPNLKTCVWLTSSYKPSLNLITPNLTTLTIGCFNPARIYIEAPVLSYMRLDNLNHVAPLMLKNIENLKTLCLTSLYIGVLLSEFPITKTVETLTLENGFAWEDGEDLEDMVHFKFTLGKVFTVFPNVTSLCIKSGVWLELEDSLNLQGSEVLDGMKKLKTICAYLPSVDRSLTFKCVSYALDQCVGLSEVSLIINADVDCVVSEDFMSKCMACWPGLKWRWGIWKKRHLL